MKAEVAAWCRQQGFFAAGDRVVCALSGGADSMAMLWCLFSLQDELSIRVSAAHFNHRLRGPESERDEAFVRDFCARHAIELTVGSAEVAQYADAQHKGVEAAAREKRYEFLMALPCDKLATAHTAEDHAETVLLHLLRGSGLRGLCGIPPQRGRLVRPLLSVTHEQILNFLQAEGIPWVEDSTNGDDRFTRNALRLHVMPLLYARSPHLAERLVEQSALLRAEDALLDGLAAELLVPEGAGYAAAPLLAAQDALQKRALRLLLRRYLPQDVALSHICALQGLLAAPSPSAQISLPGGWIARRCYQTLEIVADAAPPSFSPTVLPLSGKTRLAELGLEITAELSKNFKKIANTPFHFAVKYDMISDDLLLVRPRRSGDRLSLDGGHSKTLKKLFIERKLPRAVRERLPVFVSGDTVLAVAGIGVNRRCTPEDGEAAVILNVKTI